MKKIITVLTLIVTLATQALAGEEKANASILHAFEKEFASAKNVVWTTGNNLYRADFEFNGGWMFAYYNQQGELIGLCRNISSLQLPYYLQNSFKKKYAGYWITGLFEVSNKEGYSYYITLQNSSRKITLESKSGSYWEIYDFQKMQ